MILVNNVKSSRKVLTLFGSLIYERTFLIAQDPAQSQLLFELEGVRGIFPKDSALGIDRLPFKVTYRMMGAVAREGVRSKSYAGVRKNIWYFLIGSRVLWSPRTVKMFL
mgnify:CR=1 FL=1